MALKLLIVQNDPEILRQIKSWVQALSVEVLALSDSGEAARRIRTERFDGFLLEAKTPSPDGLELTREIRSTTSSRSAPIVLLTDADDVDTMRKAFRAGITIFLTKPVTQERVTGLIRVLRGPMLAEKQRRARLPLRTPARCTAGSHRYEGTSINLNEGGMLLEIPGSVEVGEKVEVEFMVPGSSRRIHGNGQVLRKDAPNRIAVQFSDFSPEDLQAIRQFIRGAVKE